MRHSLFICKLTALILLLSVSSLRASCQESSYAKIYIEGKPYYVYTVRAGEGLYSIAQTFSVSVDELIKSNPGCESGLKAGQTLNVPAKSQPDASVAARSNIQTFSERQSFADDNRKTSFQHIVARGETVYSIANIYDTTVEEIYRLNASAQNGIYVGDTLTIPQRRTQSGNDRENFRFHTILPKETLYSVSRYYNMHPEDVIAVNPGLSADTFQAGKTIRIPTALSTTSRSATGREAVKNIVHRVEKGETLYSIARKYNILQDDIRKANPGLSTNLKRNQEINIPIRTNATEVEDPKVAEARANQLLRSNRPSEKLQVIRVGLLLPFLDKTNNGHVRLQEYYEGFLLAILKLKDQGANIELYAFDIGSGSDTRKLNSLLGTMEMQALDLIVGGISDAQIKTISSFASKNNIKYVVPFSQSNREVLNNPMLFQVNPPLSNTYSRASEVFVEMFRDQNIILVNIPSKSDKTDFVNTLQNDLKKAKVSFRTLTLDTSFEDNLPNVMVQTKENIIVPTSGDMASLRMLLDIMKRLPQENGKYTIRLFGYPEWQTYDSKFKTDYHQFGTYFFTPFFVDEDDLETNEFLANFRKWYKRDPINLYPRYGLWGYDTGLYFISALHQYGKNFEPNINQVRASTIQYAFQFERVSNRGGFVNNSLFLVYYGPDQRVIKINKSR